MTTTALRSQPAFQHALLPSAVRSAWITLRVYRERARQRAQLAELSPGMLADIGVNEAQASAEARKPFWVE